MDAVSSSDRVGSPKKTFNSRSELEITKPLQLAGDLRSICVQKWVCGAWWCDLSLGSIALFKPILNSQ
jgi:hypothetical protein